MVILLEIQNLSVEYKGISKENMPILAVDNVSLKINQGEIYALAGESGCGKTSIAKAVTKLIPVKSGNILFNGENINTMGKIYPQKVQMVFQNPYSSLNPKMRIKDILREPLDINTKLNQSEKEEKIETVLAETGLQTSCLDLYPHEFSGGQRQRIAIARALILSPELLIADEPVSALDASIQAQILNLLKDLRQKKNLTILFISHDMNVIKFLADKTGIMHNGKIIEENYTGTVFRLPKEEYTKNLLNSVPSIKTIR